MCRCMEKANNALNLTCRVTVTLLCYDICSNKADLHSLFTLMPCQFLSEERPLIFHFYSVNGNAFKYNDDKACDIIFSVERMEILNFVKIASVRNLEVYKIDLSSFGESATDSLVFRRELLKNIHNSSFFVHPEKGVEFFKQAANNSCYVHYPISDVAWQGYADKTMLHLTHCKTLNIAIDVSDFLYLITNC
ncbi:hypothetical protein Tsp_09409 [Trichinella spiralis]|uniref:hypothetical protein n=1 Tax=Trichinella spiralis TaxID=6334 RepID=UPI0001EFD33C|nr:hypothetical protein Tsp_09409 [Trichinella spiralis]